MKDLVGRPTWSSHFITKDQSYPLEHSFNSRVNTSPHYNSESVHYTEWTVDKISNSIPETIRESNASLAPSSWLMLG